MHRQVVRAPPPRCLPGPRTQHWPPPPQDGVTSVAHASSRPALGKRRREETRSPIQALQPGREAPASTSRQEQGSDRTRGKGPCHKAATEARQDCVPGSLISRGSYRKPQSLEIPLVSPPSAVGGIQQDLPAGRVILEAFPCTSASAGRQG
jgi:hypothetical protein